MSDADQTALLMKLF